MRLVSWNLQWCRGMDGAVDARRAARTARKLADPDVCCFQEVAQGFDSLPGSAGEDQVAALTAEFPDHSAHYASSVDVAGAGGARRRFGNLILSRLPVGRVLRHGLPWPASAGVPSMPRAAIEAVIEAPWGPLRVTTTHLEYYSPGQRAAQVERLLELNAEALAHAALQPGARDDEGPFHPLPRPAAGILTGDFNMRPDDPLIARLGSAYVDAWLQAHPGQAHPATFRLESADEAPYCCDFVFVTQDIAPRIQSVRVDPETRASDHQPVIVEFS
ncbi:MAG: endonuclease/exonuclease/phosphatase family protein [Betaproteobacteria bacterium]|nr:endonuclease/exonuclease/phosphatase family protein [Betaproteobacteria bacterium]